ncbi:MAG: DUF1289 domain-containing protein [Betaproteobacteria bacterium]
MVPSPCISVCQLDPTGQRCLGCTRTLEQIEAWIMLDDDERLVVWRQLAEHLGMSLEAAFATRLGEVRARELARRHDVV